MADRVVANLIINFPYLALEQHFAFEANGITKRDPPWQAAKFVFRTGFQPRASADSGRSWISR